MFEKLKKKSVKSSLLTVILLVIFGLAACMFQFKNMVAALKGRSVFEELKPEEIKEGMVVDASITANFGAFMERYEKNTSTGVKRTTALYYIIWTGTENDSDFRYMGLRVPASWEDKMEDMADNTFENKYSEPIEVSGTIKKMTSKELEYLTEYMMDYGYSKEDVEKMIIPYYIHEGSLGDTSAGVVYVIFGFGVVLIAWGVIYLLMVMNGSKLKTIRKEIADEGYTEEQVDADWAAAAEVLTKEALKIGQLFTYFSEGAKPHAIRNTRLVWAYMKTTTHRTNGIPTGTTYEVIMFTKDKKEFSVSVADEAAARYVLDEMGKRIPWMLLGYDEELRKCFRKNIDEFLNIRYNQIEKM